MTEEERYSQIVRRAYGIKEPANTYFKVGDFAIDKETREKVQITACNSFMDDRYTNYVCKSPRADIINLYGYQLESCK